MLFSSTFIAAVGFASYANAHMKLAKPAPYDGVINSPLSGDGTNFPCQLKFTSSAGPTSMSLGSTQPLAFTGGATHGGGSCQVSITYDDPPTKNSVFKVIHSIEGGCPVTNNAGNAGGDPSAPDSDTYSFTIPTNLPTGKATLAWTWFNKIGNREMYMNCAPVTLTGGSSKRSEGEENLVRDITQLMERDQAAFNSLPNMFTANILNIGSDSCKTAEGVDVLFPNPGQSVDQPGKQAHLLPALPGCGNAVAQAPGSSGATTTSAAAPAGTSNPAQGGVFATTAAVTNAAPTTLATATKAPAAATPAVPAASPSSSPAASSGASGAITAGSACSPEGLWNCIGGTSFQQCASGTWSVVQSLAQGTKCTPGQSAAINITASKAKRGIRFSSEHVRRHIHRSA